MPTKRQTEDEYFAREDALKKQKLALAETKKLEEEEKERLKKLHYMRCPKCGMELQTIEYRGIEVDRCFSCRGTWLDDGELEKVAEQDSDAKQKGTWVRSVLGIFEPSKPAKKK